MKLKPPTFLLVLHSVMNSRACDYDYMIIYCFVSSYYGHAVDVYVVGGKYNIGTAFDL